MKTNNNISAFIVWTPLHLFNALQYILSNNLIGKCDLYYVSQSSSMEEYYINARRIRVFRKIYYTNIERVRKNQKVWESVGVLISPKVYIRHIFGQNAVNNRYAEVFLSVPTRLNDAIIWSNSYDDVVGYDDGIGSYIGNLYSIDLGRKYSLTRKILRREEYQISMSFINSPNLRTGADDGVKYKRLLKRKLTEKERKSIREVFGYRNSTFEKYVYLNQPIQELSKDRDITQVERQVVRALKDIIGNEIRIRMHPRTNDTRIYSGMIVDTDSNMWELKCSEGSIGDSSVLISSFSTAQFSPKFLFDKEPYVIFTYKLYDSVFDSEVITRMNQMVEKLRTTYRDKEKITVLSTLEELPEKINGILVCNKY